MAYAKKILLFIIAIIVLAMLAFLASVIFGDNKFQDNKTVKEPASALAEFHSKNGYTIAYPSNWTVDDSQKEAPAEFIREPGGRAFFSMQTLMDPRLTKPAEMPQVHRDVEQAFKNDPAYLIEWSEWEKDDETTAENSYFVAGSYAAGGKNWRFKELSIFTKSNLVLILRGMTLKDYAGEFGPALDKIIFSVQPDDKKDIAVSQAQALFKVKVLPEVVKYEADLKMAGKKASYEAQADGEDWLIQVFEIVKNNNEPSHTATFGWYRVNKKTGETIRDL